ncbi:MAG: mechanosensitive ion channel family protein [Chitinivibrionales bacterium]|nr:mechanosensitive ion channel family protein [Chitinivibrionales bacterium]
MTIHDIFYNPILLASVWVICAVVLGALAEWIILRQAARFASHTKGEQGDLLVANLKHMIFPWFVVTGVYLALRPLSLATDEQRIVDKTLQVVIVILTTSCVGRIGVALVKYLIKNGGGALPSATLLSNVVRIVIYICGAFMLLQTLGISITPILTALGVGGLAVALALQDTLGNLFAGIQILATRKIRPGDYINLDPGKEGYVEDITWRLTSIRTLSNSLIVVPNAKISSSLITNYHLPQKELSVLVQLGVAYGSDLEKVESITIDVGRHIMKTVPGGVAEFEPSIRYNAFGDSSITFSISLRVKEFVDQYLIKHEFIKLLHQRYRQEGIEIPFPVRTVHLVPRAGSKPAGQGNDPC